MCYSTIFSDANTKNTDGRISFFLWLNNIPLYLYTISYLSIYLLMDT